MLPISMSCVKIDHSFFVSQVINETNYEMPEKERSNQDDDDGSDDDGAIMFTPHTIGGNISIAIAAL